jgi:hypothetical protein
MTIEPFRLPEPIMRSSAANFTMGHLVLQHKASEAEIRPHHDPEGKLNWLLGHVLPPFQRPAVWKRTQAIRFIESAWLGIHLGIYVVNRMDKWVRDRPHYTDLWLIDGQQRLRAIKSYLDGEFPVFGMRWTKLNRLERIRFENNVTFPCAILHEADEAKLRDLYNRLNFGGTPHKKSERAAAIITPDPYLEGISKRGDLC